MGINGTPGATGATGATGAPGTTDHSLLTNLTVDDHLQYANLSGRSGGQSWACGTGNNENCTINATANGVGNIIMNPNGNSVLIGNYTKVGTNPLNIFVNNNANTGVLGLFNTATPALNVGPFLGFYGNNLTGTTMGSIAAAFDSTFPNGAYMRFNTRGSGTNSERMRITSGGFVGIGITVPTSQLHTSGTVRFANFGVGTATFDAGGNISSVSDAKYKTAVTPFTKGLSSLPNPSSYKWNAASGLSTAETNVGFVAQDVQTVAPECVYSKADVRYEQRGENMVAVPTGTYTLSYSQQCVIGIAINSIKEQQVIIDKQDMRIKALEKKVGL